MSQLDLGWEVSIERGPDWLFLKVTPPEDPCASCEFSFADQVWSILDQQFTYRVVLELEDIPFLRSYLIGQLVKLSRKIQQQGGAIRVCGLNERNCDILRLMRLDSCLRSFENRQAAVMCNRPRQPR